MNLRNLRSGVIHEGVIEPWQGKEVLQAYCLRGKWWAEASKFEETEDAITCVNCDRQHNKAMVLEQKRRAASKAEGNADGTEGLAENETCKGCLALGWLYLIDRRTKPVCGFFYNLQRWPDDIAGPIARRADRQPCGKKQCPS